MRQETQSGAGAQHIPDGVDDLPVRLLAGMSSRCKCRKQAFQRRPLRISQIRGVKSVEEIARLLDQVYDFKHYCPLLTEITFQTPSKKLRPN